MLPPQLIFSTRGRCLPGALTVRQLFPVHLFQKLFRHANFPSDKRCPRTAAVTLLWRARCAAEESVAFARDRVGDVRRQLILA